MGKLVLYGLDPSPPTRTCKLTLSALGLEYDYKLVNLLAGEHKTKDYILKNPQHTVPTLLDDDKCIWDSHAICAYLVSKYGKNDELYPKDLYKRAIVDQRLHFESGVLFQGCLRNIALPVFYENASTVPREKIKAIYEAYDFLEEFLNQEKSDYLCGSTLTIADFSCISTVSSFTGLAPLDAVKHQRLSAWMERLSTTLPYYNQANGYGAKMLVDLFCEKVKKIV